MSHCSIKSTEGGNKNSTNLPDLEPDGEELYPIPHQSIEMPEPFIEWLAYRKYTGILPKDVAVHSSLVWRNSLQLRNEYYADEGSFAADPSQTSQTSETSPMAASGQEASNDTDSKQSLVPETHTQDFNAADVSAAPEPNAESQIFDIENAPFQPTHRSPLPSRLRAT